MTSLCQLAFHAVDTGIGALADPTREGKYWACPGLTDTFVRPSHCGVRGFVVCRTEIAERCAAALAVVETLDVLEDRAHCSGSGWPAVPVQEVELELREEALRDRIVPAVARPAQTRTDAVALEDVGICLRRVLPSFRGRRNTSCW